MTLSFQATKSANNTIKAITATELQALLKTADIQLLDVREPVETNVSIIDGAILIPLRDLENKHRVLNKKSPIVIYCHTHQRSQYAAHMLNQLGYQDVAYLVGGIKNWVAL